MSAHAEEHHVTPMKTYLGIYGALLVLTGLTYAVSGPIENQTVSILVAMAIATTKATLVCAFFMHLLHDKAFNTLVFISSLWFAAVFFIFTGIDLGSRGKVSQIQDYQNRPQAEEYRKIDEAYKASGGSHGDDHGGDH